MAHDNFEGTSNKWGVEENSAQDDWNAPLRDRKAVKDEVERLFRLTTLKDSWIQRHAALIREGWQDVTTQLVISETGVTSKNLARRGYPLQRLEGVKAAERLTDCYSEVPASKALHCLAILAKGEGEDQVFTALYCAAYGRTDSLDLTYQVGLREEALEKGHLRWKLSVAR